MFDFLAGVRTQSQFETWHRVEVASDWMLYQSRLNQNTLGWMTLYLNALNRNVLNRIVLTQMALDQAVQQLMVVACADC